jgi:hypothetical protein
MHITMFFYQHKKLFIIYIYATGVLPILFFIKVFCELPFFCMLEFSTKLSMKKKEKEKYLIFSCRLVFSGGNKILFMFNIENDDMRKKMVMNDERWSGKSPKWQLQKRPKKLFYNVTFHFYIVYVWMLSFDTYYLSSSSPHYFQL